MNIAVIVAVIRETSCKMLSLTIDKKTDQNKGVQALRRQHPKDQEMALSIGQSPMPTYGIMYQQNDQ